MLKRLAPYILLIGGIVLIGAGLVYRHFSTQAADPGAAPLPVELVGLPQLRQAVGPSAVAEISQMHGQGFPLITGGVAAYGQGGAAATIWASGTPFSLSAARMVAQMESAIRGGSSPFTPVTVRQIDGRDVYELTGMGQRHFYFRSATLVIWLAADEPIAEAALAETLEFYP